MSDEQITQSYAFCSVHRDPCPACVAGYHAENVKLRAMYERECAGTKSKLEELQRLKMWVVGLVAEKQRLTESVVTIAEQRDQKDRQLTRCQEALSEERATEIGQAIWWYRGDLTLEESVEMAKSFLSSRRRAAFGEETPEEKSHGPT